MDAEIQFGDMQFDEPDRAVRPDRDDHFAAEICGRPPIGDLAIFVDLDVMRDMEAHSQTDKTVELGGVLLGRRYLDEQGEPFVWVTDWLQADHYESTQSRFKFTHETWSDITKRRGGYPNETEMVGWYHTHPGWGIFLSDMDMFICKNFFNRPLDVALVIDPCNRKRGWFQWTDETAVRTRECAGFYLITNRHRASELEYFAELYNGTLTMNDPRYSEPNRVAGAAPIINMADRNPIFDVALMGMLAMQFVLLVLISWRMMAPPAIAEDEKKSDEDIAGLVTALEIQKAEYKNILSSLVDPESQEQSKLDKLFSQFERTQIENRRLAAGFDSQIVQTEQLKQEKEDLDLSLASAQSKAIKLKKDADETYDDLNEKIERIKVLEKAVKDGVDPDQKQGIAWWWTLVAGLVVGAASVFGTWFFAKAKFEEEFEYEDSSSPPPADSELTMPASTNEEGADTSQDLAGPDEVNFS